MINDQTRAAVLRAADFFAAHPDARTRYVLARALSGEEVSPTDPRAVCWCALGRVAKELDIGWVNDREETYIALTEHGVDNASIFEANDSSDDTDAVVAMLKELAE